MFLTEAVEKIKTILGSFTFFFFLYENRSVHEIRWKEMVKPDRP